MRNGFLVLIFILMLSGCEHLALLETPTKKPKPSHTLLATKAKQTFWQGLHGGNYVELPEITRLLTAAYLENPHDPDLAAYLGFAHIWKITERARQKEVPPTITDEIILAKKYFQDATLLAPHDPRFQGFLGDSQLVSGQIFDDQKEQVRGYFQLKRAIHAWPEFNYFTAGYPMSTLNPVSDHFKEAVNWQWETLDLCTGTAINRTHPHYEPYMKLETQSGPLRACWNSWIAPHNFEGFFLNMGDMLVKQGNPDLGVQVYNIAKLSHDYATWPYREFLEKRIKNAKENVTYFQQRKLTNPDRTILFNSGFGCVACHQK